MAGGAHGLIPAELGIAALAIVFAPKLAAKLVPYGVLGLAPLSSTSAVSSGRTLARHSMTWIQLCIPASTFRPQRIVAETTSVGQPPRGET